MKKNTINASIEFHYQGELYAASAHIDLDQLMKSHAVLPSLHHILASKMGIDQYSYQYEMLLAEDIRFAQAQGIAAQYLQDGHFDTNGFMNAWRENQMLAQLQAIATRLLGIDDLEQQPALKNALLEAYQTGRDATVRGSEKHTPNEVI
ncbi:MAG TPA: hypothetical protein ENK04_02145 [Gammaproteobacteria bacterium]|nr:hypothetical protein [Gammaproteobacteria bacterium]